MNFIKLTTVDSENKRVRETFVNLDNIIEIFRYEGHTVLTCGFQIGNDWAIIRVEETPGEIMGNYRHETLPPVKVE